MCWECVGNVETGSWAGGERGGVLVGVNVCCVFVEELVRERRPGDSGH